MSGHGLARAAVTTAVLFANALYAAPPVSAQERFDPQFFHPSPTQRSNPAGMWSADVLPDASFEVGLLWHYEANPLVVRNADSDRLYAIVGEQSSLHIIGGVGLFDFLEIGADIPFILLQSGDTIPTIPNFDVDASNAGGGVGDARLAVKLQVARSYSEESPSGAAFALVLEGLFPTGDDSRYQGDDWRFSPKLVLDGVSVPGHRVSLNLGYTFRRETEIAGLGVGGTFDWGLAATFKTRYVHVVPEVRGSLSVTADDIGPEEIPLEIDMTIRVLPIEQLQIQVGGGVGLFQGFGAPDYRVLAGASWLQTPNADRDHDGILNADDECPDEPEDFDDFEDENGCPDLDNDQDGIPDDVRRVSTRAGGHRQVRGRERLPRPRQRSGRHPRRPRPVPERRGGPRRIRGRGRLPRSRQRSGRHPRRPRPVPQRPRGHERRRGRRRLSRTRHRRRRPARSGRSMSRPSPRIATGSRTRTAAPIPTTTRTTSST